MLCSFSQQVNITLHHGHRPAQALIGNCTYFDSSISLPDEHSAIILHQAGRHTRPRPRYFKHLIINHQQWNEIATKLPPKTCVLETETSGSSAKTEITSTSAITAATRTTTTVPKIDHNPRRKTSLPGTPRGAREIGNKPYRGNEKGRGNFSPQGQ